MSGGDRPSTLGAWAEPHVLAAGTRNAARATRLAWLRSDLVAGVVLAAFLVPVGMGYAEAAGLPAITGLYATIVPLVAYAIFGPSRVLVLGPDSSLAPVIAAVVVGVSAGASITSIEVAGALAVITGS